MSGQSHIAHPAPMTAARSPVLFLSVLLIALPVAIPIITVLATLLMPDSEVWQHLRSSVLPEYVGNTAALLVLVAIGVTVIGVTCAWCTATHDFPGRRWLTWALILPFAAPAYVVAYSYADLLAFDSGLQQWARAALGLENGFPSIRSLPGAALILSLALYPYVYLFAYTAFANQARPMADAARMLGAGRWRAFSRIAIPHARPAIAGGVALALMETAADFGVVDFFGVSTLTTGIFRTWYAQGEQRAALQLAAWLFIVVLILVLGEKWARRGLHANPVSRNAAAAREPMRGLAAWGMSLCCLVPVALGFVVPVALFAQRALTVGDPMLGRQFGDYVANTVFVAGSASLLALLCALVLVYALRTRSDGQRPSRWLEGGVRLATLGYALPGMVLAIGFIGPLTTLDKWLAGQIESVFGASPGLLLTGSAGALIFVCLARFLTVAFNSCDSGMNRIHPHYDGAARSLGSNGRRVMTRIHLPILMPSVLTALLLVFVDVVKELPATLILRPFNFETLATRAYRLASDERVAEASTAALAIVLTGLVPTLLVAWQNFGRGQKFRQ